MKYLPWICLVVIFAVFAGAAVSSALADKAFLDEFKAKYVKESSADAKDVAFKSAVDEAKCAVCHGKSKKDRNAYGEALGQFLSRKTDKDNKEKIQTSLDKVAAMKVKAGDAQAPTFGDLIKEGKLPAEAKK